MNVLFRPATTPYCSACTGCGVHSATTATLQRIHHTRQAFPPLPTSASPTRCAHRTLFSARPHSIYTSFETLGLFRAPHHLTSTCFIAFCFHSLLGVCLVCGSFVPVLVTWRWRCYSARRFPPSYTTFRPSPYVLFLFLVRALHGDWGLAVLTFAYFTDLCSIRRLRQAAVCQRLNRAPALPLPPTYLQLRP